MADDYRYVSIAKELRQEIENGMLAFSAGIPSEHFLADFYKVSRSTIRAALDVLVRDRTIEKRMGRNSKQRPNRVSKVLSEFSNFKKDVSVLKTDFTTTVVSAEIRAPNLTEALFLPGKTKTSVLQIIRIRYLAGRPAILQTTSLPSKRLPGFAADELVRQSLYAHLQSRYDISINASEDLIDIAAATPEQAAALKLAAGDPLFRNLRIGKQGETVIEISEAFLAPSCFRIQTRSRVRTR